MDAAAAVVREGGEGLDGAAEAEAGEEEVFEKELVEGCEEDGADGGGGG